MCNKDANSIVEAQRTPAGLVADLLMTAERELATFYTAVVRGHGPEEARKAANDWIEEVETMDWPVDGSIPDWRHVSTRHFIGVSAALTDSTTGYNPQNSQNGTEFFNTNSLSPIDTQVPDRTPRAGK
jgi:hypothetical protein